MIKNSVKLKWIETKQKCCQSKWGTPTITMKWRENILTDRTADIVKIKCYSNQKRHDTKLIVNLINGLVFQNFILLHRKIKPTESFQLIQIVSNILCLSPNDA